MSAPSTDRSAAPPARGLRRTGDILAWLLTAATILSNICWVVASGTTRDALTVVGVLTFFAASATHALVHRGVRWSAGFFALSLGFGWAVEAVGTATGVPFGDYTYSQSLGVTLGFVPLVIPLAWAMMAYPCFVVADTLQIPPVLHAVLSAALLAGWDLFLDPQMVGEGYWTWLSPQPDLPGVPGIPLSNFAGWIVGALALMSMLVATHRGPAEDRDARQPVVMLTWVYCGSVLANAAFLDRPGVALVGGIAMGVPMALLWFRLARRAPTIVAP